ncbi:MAG: hypothetical protein DRQ60_06965, partial [Gammaproteobacteria bacterium]
KQQVALELKTAKEALDKAYLARDAANTKIAEFELKEQEKEIERLKENDQHKEAYELQLQQEKARYDALATRNTELTRDMEIKSLLGGYNFKSDNALNMAYRTILSDVVKSETGDWVTKDGKPLSEGISTFMTSDDNSFLLKPVVNSGSGHTQTQESTSTGGGSLFEMSQEDVLKMAAEGKL